MVLLSSVVYASPAHAKLIPFSSRGVELDL